MTKDNQKQFWAQKSGKSPSSENIAFCASRDVRSVPMLDDILIPYDLWTNYAHCQMLCKQKILQRAEWSKLQTCFRTILLEYQKGSFTLDPTLEDVHTNIENYIIYQKQLAAGKKIHTARSRNDQVITTMRLFLKDKLLLFIEQLVLLNQAILAVASKEQNTPMIGFTHYQPAMPTTLAHWLAHWAQAITRSIVSMLQLTEQMNLSPLGAVAGFGTTWQINREYTASLLGFEGVEENSLDCVSARGEWEARIAASIALFMNQACLISQDLIMLSHPYFGMIKIDDAFVTGSSIMPQKKNPDFAEMIRAKCSFCQGSLQSLLSLAKGIISGYNRDSQQAKYLIFDVFFEVEQVPKILKSIISTFLPCRARMKELSTKNYATSADLADYLAVNSNLAFRDSYHLVALAVRLSKQKINYQDLQMAASELGLDFSFSKAKLRDILSHDKPMELITNKLHTGAPAPSAVAKNIAKQKLALTGYSQKIQIMLQKSKKAYLRCFPT